MTAPRRIPLEDFFRKPDRASLRLSPSGRHLAFLAPWERRLNVHVRDLATGVETRITEAASARDTSGRSVCPAGNLIASDLRSPPSVIVANSAAMKARCSADRCRR